MLDELRLAVKGIQDQWQCETSVTIGELVDQAIPGWASFDDQELVVAMNQLQKEGLVEDLSTRTNVAWGVTTSNPDRPLPVSANGTPWAIATKVRVLDSSN